MVDRDQDRADDDGWHIDDVEVTDTLGTPAASWVDSNDNSALPDPPDGDGDGYDGCTDCDDGSSWVRPGAERTGICP